MTTSLRPMSLGELLDRSFYLYREHFALFVGILALPNLALLAFQLARIAVVPKATTGFVAASVIWTLLTALISLTAAAVSHGGTVIAVSKVHLGQKTTVSEVFASLKGKILRLALIMLGVGIGVGIGFILLIVPGIIFALMWSLTIPVAVVEDTGLRESTSRSAELTKGSRGRIFVIGFLFAVLFYIVFLLLEVPILAVSGLFTHGRNAAAGIPVWTLVGIPVGSFLTQCLAGPLLTIALSLVYYDQRVRKEAFDLQLMMSTLDTTQGGAPSPAPV